MLIKKKITVCVLLVLLNFMIKYLPWLLLLFQCIKRIISHEFFFFLHKCMFIELFYLVVYII